MKFTAKIIDAKLISPEMEKYLSKNNGKIAQIEIIISKDKLRMYHFLYGVLYKAIGDEVGYNDLEDVDFIMKDKFLYEHFEDKITGEVKKRNLRKSLISKDELGRFIDKVMTFANTELQLNIQSTQEYWET